MSWQGLVQAAVLAAVLRLTVPTLGRYLTWVYQDDDATRNLQRPIGSLTRVRSRMVGAMVRCERAFYRLG